MKTPLLLISALMLCNAGWGQNDVTVNEDLYRQLRREPARTFQAGDHQVQVVNDRYEACSERRDARYMRVISPDGPGYRVLVWTPRGELLMAGQSLDASGAIPHGDFHYYDQNGTLRSEGRYSNGVKIGVWHRYDAKGQAMSDKEYDGLNWDDEQVKLGLASITRADDQLAVDRPVLAGE